MSLLIIVETTKLMEEKQLELQDREFILRYAVRTGDMELTERLIEELSAEEADREKIRTKYLLVCDKKIKWVEELEDLIVSVELYRAEEKKALEKIAAFLSAHGIELTEEALSRADYLELKEMVSEVKDQREEKQGEENRKENREKEMQEIHRGTVPVL